MPKLVAIAAAVILRSVAVAAEGQPVEFDVGCKSEEDMRKYSECTAGCKKTSDKAQKTCNDAYRACRSACTGEEKRACRKTCRDRYRQCSGKQRAALKSCRADCITDNNCEHIPGTPE